ncbi:hypothetical protein [Nocardia sp. NPDC050435]|uniref:hypothetical protein n=1 Tax=Nocardia sp. NPDC050435 TaxID=3155040 RepID=UPI0033E536E4
MTTYEPPTGTESVAEPPTGTEMTLDASSVPFYPPELQARFSAYGDLRTPTRGAAAAALSGVAQLVPATKPSVQAELSGQGMLLVATAHSHGYFSGTGELAATAMPRPKAHQTQVGVLTANARSFGIAGHSNSGQLHAVAIPTSTARFDGSGTSAATARPGSIAAAGGFGVLAVNVVPPVVDNFNRAALGANWVPATPAPIIVGSSKVQAPVIEDAKTVSPARWVTPRYTDRHEVACTVVTPTGTARLSLGMTIYLRATANSLTRVEAAFTDTRVSIQTRVNDTVVERHGVTLTVTSGMTFRLTAIGTTYNLYVGTNTTPTCTWTDTNTIPIGPANRNTGFMVISDDDFFNGLGYGWAIDEWSTKDI